MRHILAAFVVAILAACLIVRISERVVQAETFTCTTTLAGNSSSTTVGNAINAAANNAVICFTAGSGSWGNQVAFANNKGVTLVGAQQLGTGTTTITLLGNSGMNSTLSGTNNNLYRVTGFTFTSGAGNVAWWFYGPGVLSKLRYDHNIWSNMGVGTIAVLIGCASGCGGTPQQIFALFDNNTLTVTSGNNFMLAKVLNVHSEAAHETGIKGTLNNVFFETNTLTFNDYTDTGSGVIDQWFGGSVFRFNTITNSRMVNHSFCHGTDTGHVSGPSNSEVYGNTMQNSLITPVDFRLIHWQGSMEEMAWGNTLRNTNGDAIVIQHFRDYVNADPGGGSEGGCTNQCIGTVSGDDTAGNPADGNRAGQSGYPCWRQPGRDENAVLKPVYLWNNRTPTNANITVSLENMPMASSHFVENRDYYQGGIVAQTSPTSPFNGTVGIGWGTLANRPTTCTATAQAADAGNGGVGYFVTDVGAWRRDQAGASGRFYRCSATNTWTLDYTPAPYPHPLIPDTAAPASPTSPRVG